MSDLDKLVARATTGGIERAYKAGAVPQKPTYPYAVFADYRMPPTVRTIDGSGDSPKRFTGQFFGQTADGITTLADLSLAAFDGVPLTDMPDSPVCWVEITTPPYRDPDNGGVLNITHTYRF